MSYSDDYYKALRKEQEKKKKKNSLSVQPDDNEDNYVSDSYSQGYYDALSKTTVGTLGQADTVMSHFWNDRVNDSVSKLNRYRDKINSGGYLSTADLSAYEKALSYYKLGSNKLRSIFSRNGYETEDDESWNTTMSALDDSVRGLTDYFSQWKDEEEFNKDKSYRKSGKDFSELDEKDLKKRIAEYKEKATNAIDKNTQEKAQKELNILNAQLEFKQKVNEDLKLLKDEKQKEAYLYYLGKDLEDGTSYADEYIASVTSKDDSGMQFFQKGAFSDGYQFGDVTKAILGTAEDAFYSVLKAPVRLVEGLVDRGAHAVADVAKWAGKDEFASLLSDTADDSLTDWMFSPVDDVTDKYSVLGRTSKGIAEGAGQAATMYVAAQLLGPAGLGLSTAGTTAATTGLTYLSSTGHGISEAHNAGATDKEAQIYGRISGFADAVSELLFGGLGKGVNALGISKGAIPVDDVLAKTVSKLFNGRLGKNLAEYGIKAGAEGLEEVIAGTMQAMGKKMTYLSEEDIGDIFADENLLEQFIVGAFASGIMQGGDVISDTKAGRDFITNLSKNEQLVVDTEFNNRLQEATKDGKKLTKKQENELYEEVISDMDKGLISTDTIESVLGGEDYKGYSALAEKETSLTERKNALTKEIDTLLDKPNPTIRDNERLAAARQELANIEKSIKGLDMDTARKTFQQKMAGIVKNDTRLWESLNERERRGQDLQLDVEKYEGAARTTAENLRNFRMVVDGNEIGLNNAYNTRSYANLLLKLSQDHDLVFEPSTSQKLVEAGLGVDGYVVNGAKTGDKIYINMESGKQLNTIVGHEITHAFEKAGKYKELAKAIKELAGLRGEYQARKADLERIYAKGVNIDAEVVADLVGDYLFTDEDFINNLSTKHRNVFQKIFDEIKYLLKIATAGSEEARKLEAVKKKFEQAYRENVKGKPDNTDTSTNEEAQEFETDDVQYSISVTDSETLDFLNEQVSRGEYDAKTNPNGGYYVTYKSMSFWGYDENGNAILRSPMAEYVDGELSNAYLVPKDKSKLNWYKSTETIDENTGFPTGLLVKTKKPGNKSFSYLPAAENQDLIKEDWSNLYFNLKKKVLKKGKWVDSDVPARYNPYEHSSNSMLNDQFSTAYLRDNLVTVKMYVPVSEDKGTFRAKWSKDPTGWADWKTGTVAGKINKQKDLQRRVFLSRYAAPVEIVSDSEVAQAYKSYIEGTDVSIPDNVVSPGLLAELRKAGVPITESGKVSSTASPYTGTEALNATDEVKYSLANDTAYMDKAIAMNDTMLRVDTDVMANTKALRELIAKRMNSIKEKGLVGLPEDVEGNTYIANSSYDGTEENTTICPRSLASEAFTDAVAEYLGRPLTVDEQIYISQDLQGRTLTPECLYCYVATDRKAYRAFLGEYISQRDSVIQKLKDNPNADTSRSGELYNEFLAGRKDTKPMYDRFTMWANAYKNGTPMVEASHLANISKLMGDISSEFGEELRPQIVDAMKYAQSASWAKKRVNYVAYNGHILKWKQDRINKLNSHYGLRMYSFSDFHPAFVLENMQMITDASVRGLKMLGYTKDIDFVEIFAPTGMNINVSTFGFEAGGNVYENNIIGANWDKAKELRAKHPNVGVTFVATNDNLVNWALDQDWIDVVIPYHLVRTGAEVAKALNYTNYTSESADTKDIGWEKGKDKKYIAPTEHNNDKATYLAALAENHLKPRFERFIDNPNYMKLVNECRQPASVSKPVQPIFNESAAMEALAKLETNGYYQPIGGTVNRMYEIAGEVAEAMTSKSADNTNPTSDPDIRFSLSEAVEETKDLVAIHNLNASELLKTLDLGGLPMPSIAVIKAQQGHDQYGDVSLIFPKDTIDPKRNSANKVYGGDAWTPVYPKIEYKANEAISRKVRDKYYELADRIGYDNAKPLYKYVYELGDALNNAGGEAAMLEEIYNDTRVMQVFLEDTGKGKVEPIVTETRTEATASEKQMNQWFIDKLGEDVVRSFKAPSGVSPIAHRKEFMAQYGEQIKQVYRDFFAENFGFDEDSLNNIIANTQPKDFMSFLRKAYVYLDSGGVTIKTETDYEATDNAIREKAKDGYKEWVDSLFKGVEEKTGIRNDLDVFTSSGKRRSWDALHWENTLENVVRAMKAQEQTGADAFAPSSAIFAVAHKNYGSVEEIKADSNRLGRVSEEEYKAMESDYASRLAGIASSIKNPNERNPFIAVDEAAQLIVDAVRNYKTKSGMLRYMQKWNSQVAEATVDDIISLVNDIANMPTGYFEAKPQRAVGLEEVGVFVIPYNTDAKLKQALLDKGYSIAEYNPDVDGDRSRVVNQFEEYKFSLSMPGEIAPPVSRYGVYGWEAVKQDPEHPLGPTRNDVAPANVQSNTTDDLPIAPEVQTDNVDAESLVGNKDNFVSKKAMELYQEITGLKKGVRASRQLGYLLDHGYEWRSIKTALLNIRDNPNQVVNPNSQAESVAREMLGREYDNMVAELTEPTDVASKIRINMQHIQTELDNNRKLREQSNADYDAEIADTQAKYDAKKNKNTIEANNLLRRIERLSRLKNTNDANYAKRINDLEQRLEKMSSPTYKTAMQRRAKHDEYMALAENLVGDTSTWKDKKLGLSYKVNTLRRNLRDIVRDANGNRDITKADAITDEYQGNYNRNEADLKREDRRLKSPIAKLNLTRAEYVYSHMLGEFRHNPDTTLTEDAVKEYYNKHKKNIDTEKVDKAIEETRKIFDELFDRVNARLREQGMKEIPYRKGYFPHFTKPHQGFLAKLFNWKTVDNEIPTSIAGLTETFNPEKSWQSFNKERKADTTDYDLAQALDTYIHGALDWIYHIEDIQKRRALENYIRYVHSEEGVKARIKAIQENEEYDADEAQEQIDLVYAEARNPLNNFVTDLRAGTNTLAAKKSSMDRAIEEKTNRKIYSVMTNLNNRVSANMVVGSFSSALTNFIPITQSWSAVSPWYSLRGMKDTIANTIRDDGIVNKSAFLTNRLRNEENLYQTTWDKVSDKAAFLMEAIDSFTSQTVWRSKYLQNISEGMSEAEAIADADQFAENVIAGRSRGNMPTIFDAKNPITKIFTAFQLEVANQYGYFFKDAPQDAKTKARLVKGYASAFLGAYAYNALYSTLVGRTAAFDPLRILEDLFRDIGLFGDDDEEEPEDIILNLTENVLQEVPFVGGLLGGGRIPLSSALPYSGEYGGLDALVKDISEGNKESITKEWMKPLFYLVMPLGGGQLKKTVDGLGMFSDEHPISGSYTDSGNLRFPVEKTPWNVLQAGLFGQYASENARDYFDNGRQPLKEKQIQEFIDVDIPIADYWEYREGLAEQDTLEEKFDYIAGLDLPVAKKNILINNIVDREESVDMTNYEDYSSLDEFDFATKKPGKYAIAEAVGGYNSYTKYTEALGDIHADKDSSGKSINGSRKEKVQAYIESLPLDYGEKIILHKMEYPADDTYNYDIVEYLDSRDDISYEQMVSILEELGFKVNGQQISWD